MPKSSMKSYQERKSQEHALSEAIVAACAKHAVMLRNNVGVAKFESGARVSYGLKFGTKGGSDLIGIMRGTGRFVAIEVKDLSRPTPEQIDFLRTICAMGGHAGIARSVDDALTILSVRWVDNPEHESFREIWQKRRNE